VAQALATSISQVAGAYWRVRVNGNEIILGAVLPSTPPVVKSNVSKDATDPSSDSINVTVTDTKGFSSPSFNATMKTNN
jgi:hypothetical protein